MLKQNISKINMVAITEQMLNNYGWIILATPVVIYGINKIHNIFTKAIDNNINAYIEYDKFRLSVNK